MTFFKYLSLKSFSLSLLGLCIAGQMNLGATSSITSHTEDYIQEVFDSEAAWDADQLSEIYTQVNIAARDLSDFGLIHMAARDLSDVGLYFIAARDLSDVGLIAARDLSDMGLSLIAARDLSDMGLFARDLSDVGLSHRG